MKRERLQKLFSEDKEIFQGGMLFPTWICKGKEEIENRNIPQRAAVYLDIPIPCAGLLYYEKEKSLHYCEQQTYQVVTLLEGVGCDYSIEKEFLEKTGFDLEGVLEDKIAWEGEYITEYICSLKK